MSNILYWGTIYAALFLGITHNLIVAPKYQIKRWKILIITLFVFVYNWGVSYLTAWMEAGFQEPPSVNGVRAWVYVPLYFLACSLIFKIDYKRLADAMTPCFILGFAFGHLGCVFPGCCQGYAYDGFCAIYNQRLGYYTFPIQLLESLYAFLLYFGYLIYIKKTNYKVSGQLYPVMLMFYSARFIFDMFRDNEKIWLCISSLSLHALFGGIVGAIMLFFTTPTGKQCGERILKLRIKK